MKLRNKLTAVLAVALLLVAVPAPVVAAPVYSHAAHVEKIGWMPAVSDGQVAGTVGQHKRLEALRPSHAGQQARGHVQNVGWQAWAQGPTTVGTAGRSLRLEAVQLKSTVAGEEIRCQAHVQNVGWMAEVGDGEVCGTTGKSLRLEAVRIRLVDTAPVVVAEEPPVVDEPVTSPAATSYQYLGRSWPDASSVGVPAGTTLTPYTGSCLVNVANTVIDSKEIRCDDLRIYAKGVVIKNSLIHNRVYADYNDNVGSFTITDSEIRNGPYPVTGIGDAYFTAERVKVTGGGRGIACYAQCTVKDSYVVGGFVDNSGTHHMSGIRVNTNSTLIHNTIGCQAPDVAPDGGCSAAITGYPDFDPVTGNRIENNLILGDSGGYCTYGGSTRGKAYSGQTAKITFKDNVWQGGTSGRCGFWGPITSFDVNAPGNVWSNNLYTDGAAVAPAN